MDEIRTAFEERVATLAREGRIDTPCLVMSRPMIEKRCREVGAALPGSSVWYAAKANDSREILEIVAGTGIGFEVASKGEMEKLEAIGVTPDRMITSNPIKRIEFIRHAWEKGIRMFAFDSAAEVDKMVEHAPGCEAVLRLFIENDSAEWPLSGKFGVPIDRIGGLLRHARARGLNVVGVNFHVGSQCTEVNAWDRAIAVSADVFAEARQIGFEFDLLNLGGGYPATYLTPVPDAAAIEDQCRKSLARYFPGLDRVFVEPGRFVVGDAGVFVTRVIGKAIRSDGTWVFIDTGVFNGLAEAIGGIRYPLQTLRDGEVQRHVLAGPSCDGFDVIDREAELVEPEVGDIVLLKTAGAYTTVYAATFNGFAVPEVRILEETWPT